MTTPTHEQFRAVGFTGAAADHPRDEMAIAMFAAFNGVTVEQLSEPFKYFPNVATEKAWKRVADVARSHLEAQEPGEVRCIDCGQIHIAGEYGICTFCGGEFEPVIEENVL